MVEHSQEVIEKNHKYDENKKEYEEAIKNNTLNDELEKIHKKTNKDFSKETEKVKKYYSQFKNIIEILAQYHDTLCNNDWWKDKSMSKVWLYKANLQYAKFSYAHLKKC